MAADLGSHYPTNSNKSWVEHICREANHPAVSPKRLIRKELRR